MTANAPERSILSIRNVSFRYVDGAWATKDVSLDVKAAEIVCLLGPNGAGKTTLIRQIVGDRVPETGSIEICGMDSASDPALARTRIGIIPQQTHLFDGLTVGEHLHYLGRLKGLDSAQLQRNSRHLCALLDLSPILDKRARTLSGGQQRLVLLALALLADPPLLILDEPTTGLDPIARERVWAAIRTERDAGKAILLTTHYLEEAETLSDRVGFIVKGRLARLSTVAELCSELRKSIRVTVGREPPRYFSTLDDAEAFVKQSAYPSYSISPTSLSDVYNTVVTE